MSIGFIGIGVMGQPMAMNLLRAGVPLIAWNRTRSRCDPLAELGAAIAATAQEVFEPADAIILMLIDEKSTDLVLDRGGATFADRVTGRLIVQMGTMSPEYSRSLEADVVAAGGRYVEAPVSGSRRPAELGQLVAMVAGADADALLQVRSLLAPMCVAAVECGAVPGALSMKLAVNLYMIGMVTALTEAFHFAGRQGLDVKAFAEVLAAGPMDSSLARIKTNKLAASDFEVQAAVSDVIKNADLVVDAACRSGTAAPLIELCASLYHETGEAGWGKGDMIAVVKAFEGRTARLA